MKTFAIVPNAKKDKNFSATIEIAEALRNLGVSAVALKFLSFFALGTIANVFMSFHLLYL